MKNRQQMLLMLAGLAVVLMLGDRLVLTPLIRGWKERAERIVEVDKMIAQGRMLVERESLIRSRWAGMRTNTLPENISVAENEVLQAFEHWSQLSQISISGIKPQWKRPGDDYATLECRADAFGSIQALTRFLYQVERDPLALRVESVEISARDNNGQQLSLGLQISGLLLNPQAQ